jgi:hypothetical protein
MGPAAIGDGKDCRKDNPEYWKPYEICVKNAQKLLGKFDAEPS